MGVFARFLRRSKAAEEASTADTRVDTTAETQADGAEGADEAKGSNETTVPEARTEAGVAKAGEAEAGEAEAEVSASEESCAGDDVEIPQQQTVEKAADNEAGEGART